MAARSKQVLAPSAKLIRVGNQVVSMDDAVEVNGRTVKVILASKGGDFKASHREVVNGVLIGTIKSIDGALDFVTVEGKDFQFTPSQLAGGSITLKFDSLDTLEEIIEEVQERPCTPSGGRAVELTVMIETSGALTENSTDDGGVIATVIGNGFSLSAVSLEKAISSQDEALAQLEANKAKNRGIREESIRTRRSLTQSAGVVAPAVVSEADASLPPVV